MNFGGDIAFFVAAFASLFTIINPFSTVSVFIAMTHGESHRKRRGIAKKAVITSAVILIIFALTGNFILNFFNITIPAFKIAGGLLVANVGLGMVRARKEHLPTEKEKRDAMTKDDISIIPLAIPMMSGPGAMATALVLAGEASGVINLFGLLIAIVAVCFVSFIILSNADRIDDKLGENGRKVTDRIMGLIVLVVGVQFIINGVGGVLSSWGLGFG